MKLRLPAAFFLATMILASCAKKQESLTLAGSTAFQPFAEALAEEYMAAKKGINVIVQGGGSAVGINAAATGAAQIGMADLVELPAEAASLTAVIVARDGISLIVNPANPVFDLSLDDVRGLFNGKIRNWKELGGPDAAITVVSREAGSGTRSSFEKIVGGIELSKDAVVQDSNGTIRETVANDANAIGYVSHGLVNEKVKAVSIAGADASVRNIISGAYPLVRPVYFLTKGEPSGSIKDFIDYVLGPEGQAKISTAGLLPAK
jgi:phosphate transport system substrate-binding protein